MVAFAMTTMFASCTKEDNGGTGTNPDTSAVVWVDLGLPSGLLWANCNLGANAPEEYGNYYAWGETQPKENYGWSTYQYCMEDFHQLTKYCDNSDYGHDGFTDNISTLEAMDDAATAALGAGARTPTEAEWSELMTNTTKELVTENNVYGMKFTADNGNSIFLPAAGLNDGSEYLLVGEGGYYWSSTLLPERPIFAKDLAYTSFVQIINNCYRSYGLSVRAVRDHQ